MSLTKLLSERRFGPFFWTQCAGAFNDNVYKNAMVIMLAYKAGSESKSGLLVNAAAGLFILPFFLFSPLAGRIADRYDKGQIMRIVKAIEIPIMLMGAFGFFVNSIPVLFSALFLMGTQSTFFGPVKYSILPQHLKESELMAGNALVEMGTFLAILLGTLLGGMLAANGNPIAIATSIIGIAIAGLLFSARIPAAPAADPELPIRFTFFSDLRELYHISRQGEGIWNAIMGNSWFWYFGATVLAQLPSYAVHSLGNPDPAATTILLAAFSVSVGIGSIMTEKLSGGDIELGLVPFGALLMSIFAGDLYFAALSANSASSLVINWPELGFNQLQISWRVLLDISLAGIGGSFFIVPIYAFMQQRSEERTRSRLIAASNVFNAIFMVASAIVTMAFYQLGLDTAQIILVTAIMNFVVCLWIISLLPEFFMRFVIWILASTIYRLKYTGRDLIPTRGPAVIVANHVSYIDWFIVSAACRRPVRFVMYHLFFKVPGIKVLAQAARAIPIAPAKEDAALMERAFENISESLRDGNLVCIFPEGGITRDGQLIPFRAGIDRILKNDEVPVYVMSLNGLWGSFFSRKKGGHALNTIPKPRRRIISVDIRKFDVTPEIAASGIAPALQREISEMLEST